MAYQVTGQLVDSEKKPIEFGLVYISDASGKPKSGGKNTQTDDKGKWSLLGVEDSDYITGSMVGYDKKTVSAKSIKPIYLSCIQAPCPVIRSIQITLNDTASAKLEEVKIESKKVVIKPNNLGKYIMIGGAGMLLLTGALFIIGKSKKII
jgi:hypothetical protein